MTTFFVLTNTYGQTKQNYVWKFGNTGAGLDFTNCTPTVLTNGINNLMPFEGQSAISDRTTGRLLFYTDGYDIYDSTNNIMQNGTGAGLFNSFTQTIIIRKPGSDSIFYMFTPDLQGGLSYNINYPNAFGINWAEVDMSLNGGLGAVTSIFNSLKDTSNCEKLTGVYHSNGQDVWLIGHEYRNNNFFAFLITSSGINPIPVMSSVGPIIYTWQGGIPGNSNFDAIGELKASPNGNKLAFTTYYSGTSCIVDFNKSTGIISNPIPLIIEAGGYGVSFSPDNSKLYIAGVDTSTGMPDYPTNGKIYQFDISSNNQITIQNSRTTIITDPNGMFRSLKLGPDGKIYIARGNNTYYLSIINDPNNNGMACNYVNNGVYLNGLTGRWGLNNAIEDSVFCLIENISDMTNKNTISIYPNPFSEQTTLQSDKNLKNATLIIYNSYGQKLKQINNISDQTYILHRDNLARGLYYIRLTQDNNILMTDKLVIIDN